MFIFNLYLLYREVKHCISTLYFKPIIVIIYILVKLPKNNTIKKKSYDVPT